MVIMLNATLPKAHLQSVHCAMLGHVGSLLLVHMDVSCYAVCYRNTVLVLTTCTVQPTM